MHRRSLLAMTAACLLGGLPRLVAGFPVAALLPARAGAQMNSQIREFVVAKARQVAAADWRSARAWEEFENIEADYHRRPSCWVVPHAEWPEGHDGAAVRDLDLGTIAADVSAGGGEIHSVALGRQPFTGGLRLSFMLEPKEDVAELRAAVTQNTRPISEIWLYRWTRP